MIEASVDEVLSSTGRPAWELFGVLQSALGTDPRAPPPRRTKLLLKQQGEEEERQQQQHGSGDDETTAVIYVCGLKRPLSLA